MSLTIDIIEDVFISFFLQYSLLEFYFDSLWLDQRAKPNKGLRKTIRKKNSSFACPWHVNFSPLTVEIDTGVGFKIIPFTRQIVNIEILAEVSIRNFILVAPTRVTNFRNGGSVGSNAVQPTQLVFLITDNRFWCLVTG